MLHFDGGSVIVLGVINTSSLGQIVRLQGWINSTKYIDMLHKYFLPYFSRNLSSNNIFMHVTASNCTAGNVQRFFVEHELPC